MRVGRGTPVGHEVYIAVNYMDLYIFFNGEFVLCKI